MILPFSTLVYTLYISTRKTIPDKNYKIAGGTHRRETQVLKKMVRCDKF